MNSKGIDCSISVFLNFSRGLDINQLTKEEEKKIITKVSKKVKALVSKICKEDETLSKITPKILETHIGGPYKSERSFDLYVSNNGEIYIWFYDPHFYSPEKNEALESSLISFIQKLNIEMYKLIRWEFEVNGKKVAFYGWGFRLLTWENVRAATDAIF